MNSLYLGTLSFKKEKIGRKYVKEHLDSSYIVTILNSILISTILLSIIIYSIIQYTFYEDNSSKIKYHLFVLPLLYLPVILNLLLHKCKACKWAIGPMQNIPLLILAIIHIQYLDQNAHWRYIYIYIYVYLEWD